MYVYIISNFRSYETNRNTQITSYYAVGSDIVTKYRHILVWYMANICIQLIIKIVFLKYIIISFVIRHFSFILNLTGGYIRLWGGKNVRISNPTR